jgi:hypothetical protein
MIGLDDFVTVKQARPAPSAACSHSPQLDLVAAPENWIGSEWYVMRDGAASDGFNASDRRAARKPR